MPSSTGSADEEGPGIRPGPNDPEGPAGLAVAGRAGDVRSDLRVGVELREDGGVDVGVDSKVEVLYGDDLRREVERVLSAMGVDDARVEVEDRGALPWTVAARVEAAVRRAGGEPGDARPPRKVEARGRTDRRRLRRSRLYLPGNEPKFMVNAGLHHPDGIILDLEDSVHPSEKDAARLLVRNALRSVDFGGAELMVRINQLPLGLDDLDAVVPESPDLVLVPKVEDPAEVEEVHRRIEKLREESGVGDPIWLMPIVESALGVERAYPIAAAVDTVVALTIGLQDYTADLGVPKTEEGTESFYARTRLVNAARAAGVQPIDSVYGDVDDEEGLRTWAARSRGLGFEGMGCIHPRQVRPIHESFAPSEEEVERALRIVEAFREAEEEGLGVVSLGTKMIDRPVVLRARRVVEVARRTGLLPEEGSGTDGEEPREG